MFYPINLKIDDMKIVIIGGGKVAYRKCMNFLAFNKKVKVISQDFIEEFEEKLVVEKSELESLENKKLDLSNNLLKLPTPIRCD